MLESHGKIAPVGAAAVLMASATERGTRTPRMARAIKPGEGVLAWKAYRDRQNQDLLHRTEYLATIVSAVAEVQAPPGQDLRAALAQDTVLDRVGAMGESFSCGHPSGVQGTVTPPLAWLEGWVVELAAFILGLCLRPPPELVETQQQTTDEVIAGLLQDEAEEHEWDEAEQRQLEDREKERQAHEALCEQEAQYLASEAMAYQQWEQHVTAEALKRHELEPEEDPPPKRRCLVSLEVASGSNDRPRILQTLGFEVPSDGTELRLTLRANMETVPSEVPTIPALGVEQHDAGATAYTLQEAPTTVAAPPHLEALSEVTVPSVPRDSPEVERTETDAATQEPAATVPLAGTAQDEGAQTEDAPLPGGAGSLEAVRPTPADLLGLLEFNEYSMVYDQWKRGALTQQEILEQYGQEVVDLMVAQELVSAEIDGEESEDQAEEAPTQVLFQQRPIMVRAGNGTWVRPKPHFLEDVYERWRESQLTASAVLETYGPVWLAVLQQWKQCGRQSVRLYFPEFLDNTTEPCFAISQDVHQQPAQVGLPLKVPFSSVRAGYWEWYAQVYSHEHGWYWTDAQLQAHHGDLWVHLFRRIRDEGLEAAKLGLELLVCWDVQGLGENPYKSRAAGKRAT
ncbi:unnamed protein product [Symbiodinium microadriaticum]|nr:unnamed protein product [Symbiodinium microadriaticum]